MVGNKWLKFLLLYLGGVVVSLSQLKLVPIQNELSQELGVSLSMISWLMAIFTVSGIFLAIPGGALVAHFGAKKLLVGLMSCLAIGNLWGYFSKSYFTLLLSRVIEGISFSMIIMVGIVLINFWFKKGNSGIATGLWGTFSALGSMLAMNVFKPLTQLYGLRFLWLLIAVCAVFLLFIYLFLFDEPAVYEKESQKEKKITIKKTIKNKSICLLALAQGGMAFILFAFINLYPLIYTQLYGLSEIVANRYTGYFGLFGIPFGAVAGYLIDKTRKGKVVIVGSFLLLFVSTLWMAFLSSEATFIGQLFTLSAGASLASSCVMILAPKVVKQEQSIGSSISFINLFFYIGIFIGTPIATEISEKNQSWKFAIYALSGIGIFSLLAIIAFVRLNREKVLA
ncbi:MULTISPECIES: MFS transporter [unclassified Enterococcus]|uniref:MFS transporter n=1 Tax=unclassified Enterococcus TaxID=2608891 RepID=UPI001CE0F0A3|nr:MULTISPECIES: MFS transporter [unclassified Enterococcus]MCA5012774.1 MFS transporter [Enterococcus sp. S23]MCA5016025.1 MFS transporter [Enterococcus sp. S22(2020)]